MTNQDKINKVVDELFTIREKCLNCIEILYELKEEERKE